MWNEHRLAVFIVAAALISACERSKSRGSGPPPEGERYTDDDQAEEDDHDGDDSASAEADDGTSLNEEDDTPDDDIIVDSPADESADDSPTAQAIRATLSGPAPESSDGGELTVTITGDGVIAYRAKFGPTADVNCSDGDGYGEERPVTTQLVLKQDGLPDGSVSLCLIGRAADQWQRIEDATRIDWTLSRVGLHDFRIEPIVTSGIYGEPFEITWSVARQAHGYRVALARADGSCASPVLTLPEQQTNSVMVTERLPHGRYLACVSAFDERGNVGSAENSGRMAFDTPPVAHLLYFVNAGVGDRQLRYATRLGPGAPWSDTDIPPPWRAGRFEGTASLQVGLHDEAPRIVYRAVEPGDLGPKRAGLGIVTPGERGFSHSELVTLNDLQASRLISPLALGPDGRSELLLATAGGERSQLSHISGAPGSEAAALNVATHDAGKVYQDASLVIDVEGRYHAAFVVDGRLAVATTELGSSAWGPVREISGDTCQTVDFATLAASSGGAVGVAYLCTKVTGQGASCELRFARRDAAGDWSSVAVAAIAAETACLPFSPGRPALAFGPDGRAYVGFRYSTLNHPFEYDVAVTTVSAANAVERSLAMEEWDPLSGNARLAIDASGRLHLGYVGPDGIRLAWGEAGGELQRETVVPRGEGSLFELSDLAIAAGSARNVRQGGAQ
jgi:hypothetical protein